MTKIGVLALQGDFAEHLDILLDLDVAAIPVRLPHQLEGLDGLIIPGGESTTMARLMREYELVTPVRESCRQGLPAMGTCAGMVLMASNISDASDSNVTPLGVMDIEVRRNAFGRQVDSFEADLEIPAIGGHPFHGVFIRAPLIQHTGDGVTVLSQLPDGACVAARQGNMIAFAFHPELTKDTRLHSYFLSLVNGGAEK
jgi:5'-phosphate synthase pdxT subunit